MSRITRVADRLGLQQYTPLKFTLDLIVWAAASPVAFILRLDNPFTPYIESVIVYSLSALLVKASLIFLFNLYRQSWHTVSVRDLSTLIKVTGIAMLTLLAVGFILTPRFQIPRSVPIIDAVLGLFALSSLRLTLRLYDEHERRVGSDKPKKPILIVGAGQTGTMLAREMARHPESGLHPIGYLDDDPAKQSQLFLGTPVLGTIKDLPEVAQRYNFEEILIAMPSASGDVIRKVVDLAQEAHVKYRTFPGLYEILSEKVSITQIREVDVEDLLRREPVQLDMKDIAGYLEDRVVLITGAAGTIGSEIVRQVMHFSPRKAILIDRNENALYMLQLDLQRMYPYIDFVAFIADIQREEKLNRVFMRFRPDVVFHAAAHKHVPFMNLNPDEAILNNVVGTKTVLKMAMRHNVMRFVNISTDKAVRPTSVMGASKRIAEFLTAQAASRTPDTCAYVSVRFGNVLGSNGSVIPIFKEQIRNGGPVTVTHPDMTRYFMSVPEAVQLVLQAGSIAENGATYILDMGEQVRIMDLATDLIRLSGFEPQMDIPIEIVGKRPGEKLYEELQYEEEEVIRSAHQKIMVVKAKETPQYFDEKLDALLVAAQRCELAQIQQCLTELIPSYTCHDNADYQF